MLQPAINATLHTNDPEHVEVPDFACPGCSHVIDGRDIHKFNELDTCPACDNTEIKYFQEQEL